jgi:ribosomal subunit interface protein
LTQIGAIIIVVCAPWGSGHRKRQTSNNFITPLMQLSVRGRQLDIGEALRLYVAASLEHVLGKYFGHAIEATVTVSREGHLYRVVVSTHVGRNIKLEAQGEADHVYPAVDTAVGRLSKRLRRYKRRLRDHHKDSSSEHEIVPRWQFVLAEGESKLGSYEGRGGMPMIVAEMATQISSLTVSEAVMRMDLTDLPAMLFRNRAHGGLNMVYRRTDGNIGWIDPRGNRG